MQGPTQREKLPFGVKIPKRLSCSNGWIDLHKPYAPTDGALPARLARVDFGSARVERQGDYKPPA
ncbi:hypothetical protein PG993_002191 [Apiospora rasikravindrae]|uniref:Uncharacterized protein n=1 Tax=Apiospora rasikravindrae TaxID=990691 RepID=A0ABR1UDK5_9PEZI